MQVLEGDPAVVMDLTRGPILTQWSVMAAVALVDNTLVEHNDVGSKEV